MSNNSNSLIEQLIIILAIIGLAWLTQYLDR
jgi:hypothetical protein